jgi:hypothetical protein
MRNRKSAFSYRPHSSLLVVEKSVIVIIVKTIFWLKLITVVQYIIISLYFILYLIFMWFDSWDHIDQ